MDNCCPVIHVQAMKRNGLMIIGCILLILVLSPIHFRSRNIQLTSHGRVLAVAKRPFLPTPFDSQISVYDGGSKKFSLWTDGFDGPLYIYPFPDRQRYLCIYDYDVGMPVFIVDFRTSAVPFPMSYGWPPYGNQINNMMYAMTNIVMETSGLVRLPNYSELEEVSNNLATMSSWQIKRSSIPFDDLGLYGTYASRDDLLFWINPNRNADWQSETLTPPAPRPAPPHPATN